MVVEPMAKKRGKEQPLGHRERQIVEAVYRLGEAAVGDVLTELPDPPSYSAVRAMLGTLVKKHVLRMRRDGKRYLYRPVIAIESAQKSALEGLLSTFFGGSASDAVAALLDSSDEGWSDDELDRIRRMIDEKRSSKQKDAN